MLAASALAALGGRGHEEAVSTLSAMPNVRLDRRSRKARLAMCGRKILIRRVLWERRAGLGDAAGCGAARLKFSDSKRGRAHPLAVRPRGGREEMPGGPRAARPGSHYGPRATAPFGEYGLRPSQAKRCGGRNRGSSDASTDLRSSGPRSSSAPRTSKGFRVPLSRRGRTLAPAWTRRGQPPTIGSTRQPLGLVSFPQFG